MRAYENFKDHLQDSAKNFEDNFQNSVGEQKKYLYESYKHIKQQVLSIINSSRACTFWHNYKLSNHPERIIGLIFEVIKPKNLTLTAEEQYILLSSAYLHDLAKFFPDLRIEDLKEQPLTPNQIKHIEKFHDFDVFRLLMFHILPEYDTLDKLEGIKKRHNFFDNLPSDERKILIESIAIISGLHKSLTLESEKLIQDRMDKFLICDINRKDADKRGEKEKKTWQLGEFKEIKECINKAGIRIDLLAALLKLGDCFDISEDRIDKNRLEDVKVGLSTVDNAKVLAKWYQFTIVKDVFVAHEDSSVNIIVDYCIPPVLTKDELHKITFFRMLAEKDFEDLTYLKVIEYYLCKPNTVSLEPHIFEGYLTSKYGYVSLENGEKPADDIEKRDGVTINVKYRVHREKKGDIIKYIIKYIDDTLKEYERDNPKVNEPIKSYKIFQGYEYSPKKLFPTSKEVLFLLSFFERHPFEFFSIEEIQKKTGLSSDKISCACNGLVRLGYLEQREDNRYRKDEYGEKSKDLKQIMGEYQRNPYNLKIKAWEIETFGKFLPLENIPKREIIPTGILGLDKILFDKEKTSKGGIKADKCILIKGAPGTGKTTFAIQLLLNNEDLNCLYLTFEEDLKQLKEDFKNFGFDLSNIKFVTLAGLLSRKPLGSPEQILEFLTKVIDEENPDILVVDSITRFKDFAEEKKVRTVLSDFISILKIRHITSFFIGEEVKEGYEFDEYLVDGAIKLEYQEGKRLLEIVKIRGQDFAPGVHSYKIFDEKKMPELGDTKPGINVFPNLNTYLRKKNRDENKNPTLIRSGTNGLDELLPIEEQKGGFIEGEFVLIAGSPGSGKTLMGLQFLNAGLEAEKNKKKNVKKERSLWISFEGELNELKKSIGDIKSLEEMIENKDYYFNFKYFAPLNIDLDEFVYTINSYLEGGVKRIVIDSISDLMAVFKDKLEFKNFVNSFLQIINNYDATTMLLYRVPNFFGSPETLGIEVTSIVDTILLLKNVEVHNKIEKGIFVLKMRGRKHKSEIQPVIVSKEGLEIKKLGWSMEGLLSGVVGEIQEPEIFIKIFYENEAEDLIYMDNRAAEEFQARYPTGRVKVTWVRKPEIHIDFWSFREERGPSHSNVKIVSLKKYWAGGFIEKGQLYPLGNYIPADLKDERKGERFWNECLKASKKAGKDDKSSDIYLIPYYADINVLTYRSDIFKKILNTDSLTWKNILKTAKKEYDIELTSNDSITWDNLFNLADKVIKQLSEEESHFYRFAMPDLFDKSSFMTFFLEVLWASGGNIFKFPNTLILDGKKIKKDDATPDELRMYVLKNLKDVLVIDNREAINALETLKIWVNKKYSPNPYEGDVTQDALFSVQWYSKIKNRDKIGIAVPPIMHKRDKTSYVTYDLCCLALIKGAIAPEMGWLCIDSLSSAKYMKLMAEKKVGLPSREVAYYNREYVEFDKEANDISRKFILEEGKNRENYELKTLSRIPYYYKIESLIHNEIKDVFHPTKPKKVEDALKNASESIKDFLKKQK